MCIIIFFFTRSIDVNLNVLAKKKKHNGFADLKIYLNSFLVQCGSPV